MNIEHFRTHCISKKGVTEGFPFDQSTLVFKVMGKMFALTDIDTFEFINLKCDPEYAIELREKYSAVKPGYHMNKEQWNSVYMDDSIPDDKVIKWIDDSYKLIVQNLSKKEKEALNDL